MLTGLGFNDWAFFPFERQWKAPDRTAKLTFRGDEAGMSG